MKGISAVIAAILMLMITMALAGVAYFYISGIFASKTTIIEAVGDVEVDKPSAYTGGDAGKCDIIWKVRNVGTTTVTVTVSGGGTTADCSTNPTATFNLVGGATTTTELRAVKCTKDRNHVYKIAGPSNTVNLIAFCA